MSNLLLRFLRRYPEKLTFTMHIISKNLVAQFEESPLINPEVQEFLKNVEDENKINEAVRKMKKTNSSKKETVTFSNNETIVLSVD